MNKPSASIFQPRRTGAALALAVASFAVAFGLITLVLVFAFSSTRGNAAIAASTPSAQSSAPTATSMPSQVATTGPNIGPLTLVQGTRLVNGVYLGYPHSTAGAVSAADQFLVQLLSTLDPDRAAAVAQLVAASSYTNASDQFAAATQQSREQMGLPTLGQVPPGYSQSAVPAMYQLRGATASDVTVLFLVDLSTVSPSAGAKSDLAVIPLEVAWEAGDWKLLPPISGDAYLGLSAQPNSADAQSKGWAALITGGP